MDAQFHTVVEQLLAHCRPDFLVTQKSKRLSEYLEDLNANKDSKPDQVREGVEIYVGLWHKAVEKGVVLLSDEIGVALAKVEGRGGLYRAAEEKDY